MKKAIVNGKVILKDTVQETNVLIEDDRIVGLSDSVPDGYEIIDAKGLYVSPGFCRYPYAWTESMRYDEWDTGVY